MVLSYDFCDLWPFEVLSIALVTGHLEAGRRVDVCGGCLGLFEVVVGQKLCLCTFRVRTAGDEPIE